MLGFFPFASAYWALLQAGLDITPVITHHFPVQEFQKGFETMGSGQSGKVILDWSTLN